MNVSARMATKAKKVIASLALSGVMTLAATAPALAHTQRRHYHSHHTGAKIIGGSAAGGAVIGAIAGGPKGALIGAGVGAGVGVGANEIRKHHARHRRRQY